MIEEMWADRRVARKQAQNTLAIGLLQDWEKANLLNGSDRSFHTHGDVATH